MTLTGWDLVQGAALGLACGVAVLLSWLLLTVPAPLPRGTQTWDGPHDAEADRCDGQACTGAPTELPEPMREAQS